MIEEKYFVDAEMAIVSYTPRKLKPGMHFLSSVCVGIMDKEFSYFTIHDIPEDEDSFMSVHGAPVNIILMEPNEEFPLTDANDLGWLFDGSEELKPLTDEIINKMINDDQGFVKLHCNEEGDITYLEGKVILSFKDYEDLEDDEDED
jgi:hypothetical protein